MLSTEKMINDSDIDMLEQTHKHIKQMTDEIDEKTKSIDEKLDMIMKLLGCDDQIVKHDGADDLPDEIVISDGVDDLPTEAGVSRPKEKLDRDNMELRRHRRMF